MCTTVGGLRFNYKDTVSGSPTMRTDPPSLCERRFTLESFRQGLRQDERSHRDFRHAVLVLGRQPGSALCTLGNTKVLCVVSASVAEPSRSRPQKGIVAVEVDMSPMGSPANEANRLGSKGLELSRLLEAVLRDSRCIDIEALCIRSGAEVWKLRVDVRVLDDDGALLDAASIAASAALHHYKRPDVTVHPQHTQIHSEWQKALVPLNIYHMPICVTFGFSKEAGVMLVDPLEREQLYLDGCLVVACNKRREVCVLHQTNNLILTTEQITTCVKLAMERCLNLSELIHTVIVDEAIKRDRGESGAGFETEVAAELLTSREVHPNELVAPAVSSFSRAKEIVAGGEVAVKEENSLNEGAESMAADEVERMALDQQVRVIATEVRSVVIGAPDNQKSSSERPQKAKTPSTSSTTRKQQRAELDDLLDDLEGETIQLERGDVMAEEQPEGRKDNPKEEEETFDLSAAKKRKRK